MLYKITIRLCDKAGKVIADLEGHTHFVLSLMLSLDEELLVSASEDGEVIVWDLRSEGSLGTQTAAPPVPYPVRGVFL